MDTDTSFFESLARWSEIVGGFAFVIVAIVLFQKYLLPAVRNAQLSRNAELLDAERRRDALKADVGKARAEVEAADRDAASIVARAKADAEREHARAIAEAKADGERVVANANGELDRARMAATSSLRDEFIARALEVARRKATSRIDGATNARLVGATVDTLVGEREGVAN